MRLVILPPVHALSPAPVDDSALSAVCVNLCQLVELFLTGRRIFQPACFAVFSAPPMC